MQAKYACAQDNLRDGEDRLTLQAEKHADAVHDEYNNYKLKKEWLISVPGSQQSKRCKNYGSGNK